MNLIEQLGGYEKCKEILQLPHIDMIMNAQGLRDTLLQYRREHNIFESGDKVIYPWIGNEICIYDENRIIKTPCRHATNAEIAAGRRL